jgi:lipid A 3-O-deacylase
VNCSLTFRTSLPLLLLSLASPSAVHAEDAPPSLAPSAPHWAISGRWENDTFGGTDRFYTDGIALYLTQTGANWLDAFADRLPWGTGRRTVGYDLGQLMINPGDKLLPVPDPNDRPYAGVLFASLSLHVEEGHLYHGLKFTTGLVGPWSLAEETQKQVHRWVDSDLPRGWDYQLHNEPIFNLTYEHRRKYTLLGSARGWKAELIPNGTVMLGNLLTLAQAGAQLRIGYDIPDDFGVTLIRGIGQLPPPRPPLDPDRPTRIGVFGYGALHGNFVLRTLTLDGNTWKESASVEKKLFVPGAEVGVGVNLRRFAVAVSYVWVGLEFYGQAERTQFGAFTVTYRF